jgi:Flp pilus assembly protein TadD
MAAHFGVISINSEYNIAKAFEAREKKDWKRVEYYSSKANRNLAPIEPQSSLPISLYQGLAEYNMNHLKKALEHFKKAYSQHPNNISILNNLGSVYGQMGMLDSSIVYYNKSLAIFPHHEVSLLNLSRAYYIQKEFEKAYEVILSCDPRSHNDQVKSGREAIEMELSQ